MSNRHLPRARRLTDASPSVTEGQGGTLPLTRFAEFGALSASEIDYLATLGQPARTLSKGQIIRAEGDAPHSVYILLEGWVTSSVLLSTGRRQIVKIHLAGDILGAPSLALAHAAETLTAITPTRIQAVPHARFMALFDDHPRLAAMLFLSAQKERVALMDALTAMGRSSATVRLARVLLNIFDRLERIGVAPGEAFDLPLAHDQIADLTGISTVHVSRTFRKLEALGLLRRTGHSIWIDAKGLKEFALRFSREIVFEPSWLPTARRSRQPRR